ncbi:MAG: metallophosphoesterase [Verrucomicrobiota bacterium]
MSFRLLHFSDPHFGACNPVIARAAVEMARGFAPDLTVVSGDFSMRGRRAEFQAAADWLSRLPAPLLTVPGNHDVPGLNDLADRFFSPFRRYRKFISTVEEPAMELGEMGHLVSANSSTPFGLHVDWSRGFLSPGQLAATEAAFAEVAAGRLRVFAMHHPVVGQGTRKGALVSPMMWVRETLEKSRVDLLLAGHLHQSKVCLFPDADESAAHRLVVSQAPSICSTRLKGEPNGFHWIELESKSIGIERWRWQGDRFHPDRSWSFARSEQGWGPL